MCLNSKLLLIKITFFFRSIIVQESMDIYPILLSIRMETLHVAIWNRNVRARCHYQCVDVIVYTSLLEVYTPYLRVVAGSMPEHGHVNNGKEIWNKRNFIIYQYLQYESEHQTTTDQNTFIFVNSILVHVYMDIYPILLSLRMEPLSVPIWNRHVSVRWYYQYFDVTLHIPLLEVHTPY